MVSPIAQPHFIDAPPYSCGRIIMKNRFNELQTRPWSEVLSHHEELLREQVMYVAEESDFYRRRFREWDINPADIQTTDDFMEIPFTTKDDERQCQAEMGSEQPLGEHQAVSTDELNVTLSSSGTTGKPTYFGLTDRDWNAWTSMVARAAETMGVEPGDTVVDAIGRTIVPGGLPYIMGFTKLGANVVPAGGGSTEQLLEIITDLSPEILHSTPSHLEYLVDNAPEILDCGLDELGVEILIGGGEPGLGNPEIRKKIQSGWGAEGVRDVMGLGDVSGAIAAECPEEEGAHFIAHGYIYPELIDPETGERKPLDDSTEGELIYTPLGREATPLLRFRSGDHVRILGTECACGRKSPRLRVVGRSDDMLIYKAQNVYPEAIRDVVADVAGTTPQMKIILPEKDTVHFTSPIPIHVAFNEDVHRSSEDICDEITSAVRNRLSVGVDPTVVSPEDIEVSQYKTDFIEVESN